MIILSILVGVLTHLAWDSFTHSNTWIYRQWEMMHVRTEIPGLGATPLFKIFQHGSTVFGMGILFVWVLWWYQRAKPRAVVDGDVSFWPRSIVVFGIVLAGFVGAVIRATLALGVPTIHIARARFAGLWVTTLIALIWWQLLLYGMWRKRVYRD